MSNYPQSPPYQQFGGYPANSTPYPVNPAPFPSATSTAQPVQNYQINVMAYPSTTGYPNPGMPSNQPQPVQVSPGYPGGMSSHQPQPVQVSPGYSGGMTSNQQHVQQVSPGYPGGNMPQPGGYGDHSNMGGGVQPGQPAVCPTAPDIGQMEKIPGYEGIGFEDAILPPPTVPVWQPDQPEQKPMQNLPTLSDEEVHEAAIEFASEHCCYSKAPAQDMQVKEIAMMSAFHYKLETFTEKRESAWRFLPYLGQAIDGPANGPAPNPWDIQVMPSASFQNSKSKVEVPHTAFVKPCHTCVGNGRVRCDNCMGQGRKQCTWCKGRGRRVKFDQDEMCTSCNGTGWDRCSSCSGTGQVKCKTCEGKGNLKGFVELTVTWINHADDFISETSRMPKELVLQVTGQVAYEEENPRVYAIAHATEQSIRNASSDLVNKHGSAFMNERILKQRQCLRVIPIGQVKYEWKGKTDELFVYGYEHKVYYKEYPQKCCCTIM
ncbi:hypothetical protein JTE90_028260 [Oedothorax gibbosus]|uniref:Protein SSUH2 homolog n=1 Tax=Oedothorax gibbosus TaxID=931172 RepID=A0AAV6UDJ5_9ARAC|nr:hypothetical protein JTE90_028260 [Oedothorax gibbosus]